MNFEQLTENVKNETVLTEEICNTLVEYLNYNSTGMRVCVTNALKILKERIENGEEIRYFRTNETLSMEKFKTIVLDMSGEQIFEDVFNVEIE